MASSPTVLAGQDLTAVLLGVPAWTAMAGSYTNSWSDLAGGNSTGQFRLWPLINSVEIIGTIQHVSITGNSAFFTMPNSTYFPATAQMASYCNTNTGGITSIGVSTAGVLTVFNLSSNTNIQFHGWYSLDA